MSTVAAERRLFDWMAYWRRILFALTWRDLRSRYIGATLGLFWSFVQPLVMTVILWFVFSLVARAAPAEGAPFIAWFLVGVAAWNFFAEALSSATNSFREYAFLVKKIRFQIVILPAVKILAAAFVHLLFLAVVVFVLLANGVRPSWFWLQAAYYMLALILLAQGLSWMTASLNVFMRDIAYGVQVLMQIGFWVSPVFWEFNVIPERLHLLAFLLKLNPLVYIIRGYRGSFVNPEPFWSDWRLMLYFWLFTAAAWLVGLLVFRKLKPQFADVL